MKHTTIISAIGCVLLLSPTTGASDKLPDEVAEKKVSEKTAAAMRRYAARIAVAKIAHEQGNGKQARVELSLTNPELRGWEYDYLLSESMQLGTERHQSRRVCDAVEFGTRGLAFTGDGRLLISTEGGTVAWDYRLNNPQMLLAAAGKACLAISANGRQVATGVDDGKVELWDVATGKKRYVYAGHNPERTDSDASEMRKCFAVAVSPDGKQVASAASARSRDESVEPHLHIWSTMTRKQLDLSDYAKNSRILCVAFSPDGKFIATGRSKLPEKGGTLRLWNAQTGKPLHSINAHEGDITSLAFSPEGDQLVSASDDKSIAVWDVTSGRERLRIRQLGTYPAVAYSPDGKRIVTGDWSYRLRFWDATTGVEVFSIDSLPSGAATVAFSPDGKQLAVAGHRSDSLLKPTIWSSQVDQFPAMISDKDESPKQRDTRMSAEAAASIKELQERLVSVYDGEYPEDESGLHILDSILPVVSLIDPWGKHYGYHYDPKGNDGKGEGKIYSHGPDGKADTEDDVDSSHDSLFFSKVKLDGRRISLTAPCRIGKTSTTAEVLIQNDTFSVDLPKEMHGKFAPDARPWISLTGICRLQPRDDDLDAENPNGLIEVSTIRLADQPDGQMASIRFLDTSSRDYAARIAAAKAALDFAAAKAVLDPVNGDEVRDHLALTDARQRGWEYDYLLSMSKRLDKNDTQRSQVCQFSRNGVNSKLAFAGNKRLVFNARDNAIVWDYVRNQQTLLVHDTHCADVAVSSGATKYATGTSAGKISLWDAASGKELVKYSAHNPKNLRSGGFTTRSDVTFSFSPDGKRIVSSAYASHPGATSIKPHLHIWSAETGKTLRELDLSYLPRQFGISAVEWSPDGKLIATGDSDSVKIWDAETGKQLKSIDAHRGSISDLAFSNDGKRLVTASTQEKTVRVWDVDSGEQLLQLNGHTEDVESCAFSPDGERIISAGWDNRVRLWDAETGVQLLALEKQNRVINTIAFSPDGKKIAAGGWDVHATIWDSTPEKNTNDLP